ncbi:winged helix DNA-binding domain-containing protein [Demequina oxidasica]|uniref:winged helix DNA-binding domain-containing protein n=1 Tax=Demequina oxidasica TaxID=676199 RepID=UPI0007846CD1|nr:winged helix DNA-binding domain-containing protein [Demequina oxidasica]
MTLASNQVLAARMRALLLDGIGKAADAATGPERTVAGIVEWFGAMQAQDLASGLWSFGMRIPGATESDITDALERKEALRTWPMRGTVHFVPSRDAKWMVKLMGAKPLAGAAKRREYLGITEDTVERAVDTLRDALAGGKRLTRAECIQALNEAGISSAGQAGYHLLWYVSQVGVTCIAPHVGKEQTFVLLDEFVPDPHTPERDEALGIVALRYVRSHGPVTVREMARWTGMGVRDCRTAVAAAGDAIVEVETEDGPMLATPEALDAPCYTAKGFLTPPGFDEYMLGYGDRSAMLDPEGAQEVVPGNNGVFRATLVRGGRVVGTWKRTMRAKSCVVEAAPLGTAEGKGLTKQDRAKFEGAFAPYGTFVGMPIEVRWV